MRFEVAHRVAPHPGEVESGDAVFAHVGESRAVVAIVDGLGHGPLAARAAKAAIDAITRHVDDDDAVRILGAVHAALPGTRGAAATVCLVDGDRVSACGVGNVALRSSRAEIPFVLSPGILGMQVRRYRGCDARLRAGTRIVLHSDGIASELSLDAVQTLPTDEAAAALMRAHRKTTDDASVLVLDVRS